MTTTMTDQVVPAPSRYWTVLATWPVVAVFIASNLAAPLYPLWQKRIGFSSGTLTLVFVAYIVGLITALLVAGVVSDRIGRKPVLIPALLLAIAASAIFATAGSVTALLIARVMTGLAAGAVVSAGMAAVSDVTCAPRKPVASLLASTGMVAGVGIGPLLAGVMAETLPGPTSTVFVLEAVLLSLALLVVIRMPLPRKTTRGTTGSWIRIPGVPKPNRRHLVPGVAVFAPGITATSFVLALGSSLLSDIVGTDNLVIAGSTAFVMFAASTGVQFAVRRLPLRRILLLAATSTTLSMVALMFAVRQTSLAALVVAAIAAGAGQGLSQLGGLTLLNGNVPAGRLAEANAALNVGGYLPAGLLSIGVGYASDLVGLAQAATGFAVLMVLAAAAGATIVVKRRHAIAVP